MTVYILIAIVGIGLGIVTGRLLGDSDAIKNNKDLDSTIANLVVPALIGLFMIGLFLGEFVFEKTYLTEALIHTIIGFLAGWYSNIINTLFVQRKDVAGQNGQEYNQRQTNKKTQSNQQE